MQQNTKINTQKKLMERSALTSGWQMSELLHCAWCFGLNCMLAHATYTQLIKPGSKARVGKLFT